MRALVVACAACLLTALGCRRGDESDLGAPVHAASVASGSDAAPRRPRRSWYMGRTADRCSVYAVDGDAVAPPVAAPCPADLLPGERLRIAGKTCIRESTGDPARVRPVVCPYPLTHAEAEWLNARLDGGVAF